MIGVVGAVVAVAVVLAIVLGSAVRPPARRFARAVAALRSDLDVRLSRLRDLRRARPAPGRPPGRHRRVDPAP